MISIFGIEQGSSYYWARNRTSSGTIFTECFKTMYTAYLPATEQTTATPNIVCYIRHNVKTPCKSGLIEIVILFNRIILSVSKQLPREITAAVCV